MLRQLQPSLFSDADAPREGTSTSGSFVDNVGLPVHRWFRYSAGFSGAWAEDLSAREAASGHTLVFDPFAGSGTTLIAAEQCGVESRGIDPHPFVARIARAKLAYRSSPDAYLRHARHVLTQARRHRASPESSNALIRRCYTDESLEQLDGLRQVIECTDDGSDTARLVWLALVSILRPTSHVGTANWQYLLPNRRKARVPQPFAAFSAMTSLVHRDMISASGTLGPRATFTRDDARSCDTVPADSANDCHTG